MQARNQLRTPNYSAQCWLLAIITVMRDRITIHAFPCFQHLDPCVGIEIRFNIQRWCFGLPFGIVYVP